VQVVESDAEDELSEDAWRVNAQYAPPEDLKRWLKRLVLKTRPQQHAIIADRGLYTRCISADKNRAFDMSPRDWSLAVRSNSCEELSSLKNASEDSIPAVKNIHKQFSHPARLADGDGIPLATLTSNPFNNSPARSTCDRQLPDAPPTTPVLHEQDTPFQPAPPSAAALEPLTRLTETPGMVTPAVPSMYEPLASASGELPQPAKHSACAASVWTVACMLFEMLYGHHPFPMRRHETVEEWVAKVMRLDIAWPADSAHPLQPDRCAVTPCRGPQCLTSDVCWNAQNCSSCLRTLGQICGSCVQFHLQTRFARRSPPCWHTGTNASLSQRYRHAPSSSTTFQKVHLAWLRMPMLGWRACQQMSLLRCSAAYRN
jgi:hypothetical protein